MTLRHHARAIAKRLARALVRPLLRAHVEDMGPTELTKLDRCLWCREPLGETRHPVMSSYHIECAVRQTAGSIAHVQQRCSCFVPGATETDPDGMSRREAAMAVYKHVRAKHFGPPS